MGITTLHISRIIANLGLKLNVILKIFTFNTTYQVLFYDLIIYPKRTEKNINIIKYGRNAFVCPPDPLP